jgi:hypothetical protein
MGQRAVGFVQRASGSIRSREVTSHLDKLDQNSGRPAGTRRSTGAGVTGNFEG